MSSNPLLTMDKVEIDTSLLERIRAHIESVFAEAYIEPNPFPHLMIENFFPEDIFQSILNLNPFLFSQGEEWISRKKTEDRNRITSTPYHLRKQVNFHKGPQKMPTREAQEFWDTIQFCFISGDHWFEKLVLEKYKVYFQIRFGALVDDPNFFDYFKTEFFLQRHTPGYYLGPHTDIPTRVFTCLFSFAESSGFEEYGTQICVPKDPLDRCWGNSHYSWDNFEVVKVAPYKPNNFFLFFKTRHSFHAVKKIDIEIPNQRYGMQFQFYEPAGGVFHDMSTPDLMQVKHHRKVDAAKKNSIKGSIKQLAKKYLS
jgi:hypothetical protein